MKGYTMGLSIELKKKVNGFCLDAKWHIGKELAVLFGYSGAGKSMTLQMIAGLMRPDTGTVCSNGKTLFDSGARVNVAPRKRAMGYVFQDLALFPHMTVKKNIAYGLIGCGRAEVGKRTVEMIGRFRLEGLENRYPAEISGGQKQRVACARALIGRPAALLLDEPFSALDNPIRLQMRRMLKDIQREFGIPVILVTHDLTEAVSLADKMIVYSGGRVMQIGRPEKIIGNPANSDVGKLFSSALPVVSGK